MPSGVDCVRDRASESGVGTWGHWGTLNHGRLAASGTECSHSPRSTLILVHLDMYEAELGADVLLAPACPNPRSKAVHIVTWECDGAELGVGFVIFFFRVFRRQDGCHT